MTDVVILFGGSSDERWVSVATAQNLAQQLPEAGLWFQTAEGTVTPCDRRALEAHREPFTQELKLPGKPSWPNLEAALDDPRADGKVFLLGFHGGQGEDGTVQRALESRGRSFTGSGSKSCADTFDKEIAKWMAREAGLRTVPSVVLKGGASTALESEIEAFRAKHDGAVAKPVAGGSSIGVHFVRVAADSVRVAQVLSSAPAESYLLEALVSGTELTVGVAEDAERVARALPCTEVRLEAGRTFDYAGKYLGQATEITPAEVSPEVAAAAQAAASTAHRVMGCFGYSRTDMIASAAGLIFLEINTLPGLTRASFIPQQLAAAEIPLKRFLETQLQLARRR